MDLMEVASGEHVCRGGRDEAVSQHGAADKLWLQTDPDSDPLVPLPSCTGLT